MVFSLASISLQTFPTWFDVQTFFYSISIANENMSISKRSCCCFSRFTCFLHLLQWLNALAMVESYWNSFKSSAVLYRNRSIYSFRCTPFCPFDQSILMFFFRLRENKTFLVRNQKRNDFCVTTVNKIWLFPTRFIEHLLNAQKHTIKNFQRKTKCKQEADETSSELNIKRKHMIFPGPIEKLFPI